MDRRNNSYQQRGGWSNSRPIASSSNSGGQPRRNDVRVYDHQQDNNFSGGGNWACMREFEDRPPRRNKPTMLSQNFAKRGTRTKEAEDKGEIPASAYRATKEDAPRDEPLYHFSEHQSGVPITSVYCQNFEFSGFIDLVEDTYRVLQSVDPRLSSSMPFSMYLHYCNTLLQCHLIDRARDNQCATSACSFLNPESLIPAPIYDYIALISNTVTTHGDEVRFNYSEGIMPQAPILDIAESGSFGAVLPENHNAYECNISPLIVARRVQADAANNPKFIPLPPGLAPQGGVPTPNLLGFGRTGGLPPEGAARLAGLVFPDDDTVPGRLKICAELNSQVNGTLRMLKCKFKMKLPPQRTKCTSLIPAKTSSANELFVCNNRNINNQTRLSTQNANINSSCHFSATYANIANIMVMHRSREQMAAGPCYVTAAGNMLQGWVPNINNNFNMIEPFGPVQDVDFPLIRTSRFMSYCSVGTRTNAINQFDCQFLLEKN